MTALAVLAATIVTVAVIRDVFVPAARAVEVWGGFEITGWLAIATAPIHWALFAIAAWAFWNDRRWILPWAAAYVFYAAVSHVVWSEVSPHGRGWRIGVLQALALSAFALVLLRARRSTTSRAPGTAGMPR